MRAPRLGLLFAAVCAAALPAQDAPPPNGPRRVDPGWHAFVGARVIVAPGEVLEQATVVIRDGRIVTVEAGGAAPAGARVHDCAGKTIHAAWIDAHVPVDVPPVEPDAGGSHWHPDVTPQRSALDGNGIQAAVAAELRALGFGSAALWPSAGIVRGQGAVVTLEEPRDGHRRSVLEAETLIEVAFDRARDGYPRSLMGSIALLRQTFADADWFARRDDPHSSAAFAALRDRRRTLCVTRDELDALRAARVLAEFDRTRGSVLLGSGTEFRRLDAVAALGLPIVLPLAFPDPPEVATVRAAEAVDLRQMMTWEQAPTNPARLRRAGVPIALTTDRLEKRGDFFSALRRAIEHGLAPDDALAALTTAPAGLLGLDSVLGTVERGKRADLCIVDGEPFAEERVLREVWIGGQRHVVAAADELRLDGEWQVTLEHGDLRITAFDFERKDRVELVSASGARTRAGRLHRSARQIDLTVDTAELGAEGTWKLTALVQGERMSGLGVAADGSRFAWTARRAPAGSAGEAPAADATETPAREERLATIERPLPLPFGAFGRLAPPARSTVVVRGATLWTAADAGIVTDGALVVVDGLIAYVGPTTGMPPVAADLEIDGTGLHVTPGLIDCHSHTGIDGGVNEGSQAVTAEVRIGDVLDPDDVNWYRQLAGGVTAVNQLHGSANPIGGQSQVVKLRWGVADPEQMKLAGSRPGIKFALGENVKRSRSSGNDRYPNSRMGVEALIRDRFVAAREYVAARAGDRGAALRRDLELDALGEILLGERLVHCHSYRQDEILMLCRLAGEFGFRIGTFQHGLEGYKVAEAIKDAAIGASIFSDWWAYKYEVVDAIPENAAIMTQVGVNVSFNSDSNELARRLNVEAAKAVKYGGLAPHEALKLVTINPARQLAIDDRIGSLEPGKSGDFAIWSGDPLSAFSRCVETWIDGRRYWSRSEDEALRRSVALERARLIQVILATPGKRARADADDAIDNRPGDCGCASLEELR